MPNAIQKARDLFNKLNRPISFNPNSFGGKVASGILKTGEAFQRANPISAAKFATKATAQPIAEYTKGQVIEPAKQGFQSIKNPGIMNKVTGALQIGGAVFGATPAGAISNAIQSGSTFLTSLPRTKNLNIATSNSLQSLYTPQSFAEKGLGIGEKDIKVGNLNVAPALGLLVDVGTGGGDPRSFSGFKNLFKPGSVKSAFKLDSNDLKELVKAEEILKDPEKYISKFDYKTPVHRQKAVETVVSNARELVDRLSAKHLTNKALERAGGDYNQLIKELSVLHSKNRLGNIPGMGLVDNQTTSKYASNINLDNFNVSPQAKEQLRKAVEDINSELSLNKGKPLTDKEVLNLAQVSDSLKRVVPREQTEEFAARLTKLRQNVAAGAEGAGLSKDFINDLEVLSSVAADTGRRLQKFSIGANPDARTIKQEIVAELIKMGKSADEILEKAKGYDLTNPGQATEFYRKFVKPSFGEKLSEYRYINLLSSPKTHIVNAFSNALQAGVVSPGTKLFSGAVDMVGSTLTGKQRQHYVSEVPAYYKGLFNSLGEATKESIDVFLGKKFVGRPDVGRLPTGSKVLKPLQFIPRALEANDVFFRTLIRGGEKESLLKKLARQGKELSEAKINQIADDKASYFVFRQALDSSNKSGQGKVLANIDKLTESVYSLRKVPGVSWFIPFVQTPMNILKQGIEYSPLGLTTLPGAANKTEQLSKALMGSTVMAGAAWLAQAGDSTWAAPVGEKDKEAFYASGRQPYSIKIGDQWVSYSRLGPLAYPIAMAAAIKHYSQQDPKSATKGNLEKTASILGGLAKFFSDQSYMQGLGDLVKTVQGDTSAAKQFVTNAPSQLIPLESLLGWVARTIDPIYRKPSGPIEQIQSQIPFLSKGLEPYRNPGGEPSVRQNAVFNSLSPVTSTPNQEGFGSMYELKTMYKRFDTVESKVKELVKEGKREEAKRLIENNREILSKGQVLKSYSSKVKDLQDARDKVLADTRLNEEQKQQILQKISQQLQQVSLLIRGGVK